MKSSLTALTRRRFVQGLAGGALLSAGPRFSWGLQDAQVLRGPHFELTLGETTLSIAGRPCRATAVNGAVPGPLLRMREGDEVSIRVTNHLPVTGSIHWHGFLLPAAMDGVPGLSFPGIAPGETFTYRFRVRQSGTYWYHSHSRFQEQTGLYGAIVIEPRDGERHGSDREHVIVLSDWPRYDPEWLFATLKRQSNYFNYGRRTVADFYADVARNGWAATLAERHMWGQMRMDPTDLADIGGAGYIYLLNGAPPQANWTGLFRRGERVRLRFINGSSMSFFDVRIPGLPLTVIAADGQDVEPVSVDEFRLGAAEVLDVLVTPDADRAYSVFAQSMDRSGYARGTLAPAPHLSAEVPAMDARALLTMADMGMGHDMGGMDHDMAGMDHAAGPAGGTPRHFGPNVDSVAQRVCARLDDPGPGLRNNGRRVLTYADLHTLDGALDPRPAQREIELHLTGHMERYVWSFNGEKFSESRPLQFNYGERLRIVLVNDTMMTHPIHLHGMWSEVTAQDGSFQVRKHTVSVRPAQRLAYLVSANAPGRWAYHCHLLYHMEAGMFREVHVTQPQAAPAVQP